MRALLQAGDDAAAAGRKVLTGLDLIRISTGVLDDAAMLLLTDLRSLDAIHISPLPGGWAETWEQSSATTSAWPRRPRSLVTA